MPWKLIFLVLIILAAGCASAVPVNIVLPSPSNIPLTAIDLSGIGLKMMLAEGWHQAQQTADSILWQGPLRNTGYPSLRIVFRPDYRHDLNDLAQAAARVGGVAYPTRPEPTTIAGLPASRCSGRKGIVEENLMTIAWRSGVWTYLLVLTWDEAQDGEALATMVNSIATLGGG